MTGLKILNEKSDQHKREKYSTVNPKYIPASRYKDGTANELTSAILHWLTLHNHWATRINTTGRYLHHQKKWIPGTTKRGTADIHAVIGGRHVSIEVKVGKDRMSDEQRQTQQDIEQSGGVYLIVKTFEDFYNWYVNFLNTNK